MTELLIWLTYLGVSFGVFLGLIQTLIKNGFKYRGFGSLLTGIFGILVAVNVSLLWPVWFGEDLVERAK